MSDNGVIHKEAFWLLVDRRINHGVARQVWTSKLLPDCVIKIEDDSGSFQNIVEWETWKEVQDSTARRWFAPCKWISPCGAVLVMAKTTEPAEHQFLKKMPIFLCDFKRTNYGMLDGKLVCHDYGLPHIMKHGMSKRMRSVKWWNG